MKNLHVVCKMKNTIDAAVSCSDINIHLLPETLKFLFIDNLYMICITFIMNIETRPRVYSCSQSQIAKFTHSLSLLTLEGHVQISSMY